jgi:ribonuclease E
MGISKKGVAQVDGYLPVDVATYLQNRKRKELTDLESRYGVDIVLRGDPNISPGGGKLEFSGKDTDDARP